MAITQQPSMAAGEIGPHLYGRTDQELYYIGMRTVRNCIIRPYGGASNRAGKKVIAEARYPDREARLIEFTFNEEQTYSLEIGHQYIRIIKDGGQVLETAQNIESVTQANPGVIGITAHGLSDGDDVYIAAVTGMVELNARSFRVANKTTDTFELTDYLGNNIDTSGYGAYVSGGTVSRIYTVTTPFTEDDLFDLNYAQDNDVLTIVHNDYYPRDITRTDHDAWTIGLFDNKEGPFKDINGTDTTVYASAVTGSVTLTASTSIFTAAMVDDLFYLEQSAADTTERWEPGKAVTAGDIRRAGFHYYEALNSATTGTYRPDHIEGTATDGDGAVTWEYLHSGFGIVKITAYSSGTSVTATVIKTLPDLTVGSGNATKNWAFAAWSDTQGYPAAAAYHKQRFDFGGTRLQPNGLWMSGTALRTYFGESRPILDDDAIKMKLNTTGANSVRHLLPLAELIALTSASEHLINGSNDVLLASEVPVNKVQGYTGSSKIKPIIINNTAIFVNDYASQIHTLKYQLDSDSFGGIDLTARSPHLFENKSVKDWAFARYPLSVIWVVMDDGALNALTFMEEQRVYAWSRHDTDGTYESVCCIREGRETASYFIVKRNVLGVDHRFIERMESRTFTEIRDAYFLDCGKTYDGRNTTATTMTITGGTAWDHTEVLTITSSVSMFAPTDIDDQVAFYVGDERYFITINTYSSATSVTGVPIRQIPEEYRGVAFTDWEIARSRFSPFHYIEGKTVNALVDGYVAEGLVVSDGVVTLPTPGSVVHIGLPYTSDLETLDMARNTQQGNTKYQTFNIPRVFFDVQETRAFMVHINGFENPGVGVRDRSVSDGYAPPPAETTQIEVATASSWSKKGRIGIRQTLPLPFTINNIAPEVIFGAP